MNLDRITFDPNRMNGQACIRSLRIPVATVLRCLASGMTIPEILSDYPDLEREDIEQVLHFAAMLAEDRVIPVA
jgi:uncharacterized protein (DUF433 family)